MPSPAFLVNRLIELLQTVADFFVAPLAFGPTEAAQFVVALETVRGSIRALPLAQGKKDDLLGRLEAAVSLLQDFIAGTTGLSPIEVLLSLSGELEVLKQKILALHLKPCTSAVTVCLPAPFSTLCVNN